MREGYAIVIFVIIAQADPARFEGLDAKIGDLREHVDTQNRYTHVVVEDLRSKLDLIAESIVDKKAERDRSEAEHERARQ